MNNVEIPVYLFTGFLEAGKTKFIQETLQDETFTSEENTLLLVCEEGEEEYYPTKFYDNNVFLEVIEDEEELSEALLIALTAKHNAGRVIVEYNGMWQLSSLFDNMPEEWFIYQSVLLCDANTIVSYNANMRSLVVDKLQACDLVAFNRAAANTDRMALHKIVRGISRRANILYDFPDGHIEYDTIEDPLPYDMNADHITIDDRDYAIFYRDIAENMDPYNGKTVTFKGIVLKDDTIMKGNFICGRHVMTCCAADIQYNGVACQWKSAEILRSYDWVTVTGKIVIEESPMYVAPGPVIKVTSVVTAEPPADKVATFY